MPVVAIKNVLVCDAVDSACVDLLKENGINVGSNKIVFKFFKKYIFSFVIFR